MSRAARLGAFIIVTLAVLVAGVFVIGSKRYLFSSTYQLKAQFGNVAGLGAGGDVRVGGVHSGTVREIVLPHKPTEMVTVIMDLEHSTHEIIKQDSVASIETEGLLGNQYVAISFGSSGSGDVRSGDLLASHPPLEMADLLKKMNGMIDSSQQAIQNTTKATANLSSITSKIDSGQGTVGALVNDKELYNSLNQATGNIQETAVQAKAGVGAFNENMQALKHNFLLRGYFKTRGYEDASELAKYEVEQLPEAAPIKEFKFSAKQIFDKQDSAKLKNSKSLNAAGEFLAKNEYGFALVVASAGMEGDTQKELTLTQARAMVVRDYLVENFAFDDGQLRTLGKGKQAETGADPGWGTVQILIYPAGAEMPHSKQAQAVTSPKATTEQPENAAATAAPKSQ